MVISNAALATILMENYNLEGTFSKLPGEIDFNYKVATSKETFLLKISKYSPENQSIDFQNTLFEHLQKQLDYNGSQLIKNKDGVAVTEYVLANHSKLSIRLFTWIDGRVWTEVNPKTPQLRYDLGVTLAKLTSKLKECSHNYENRELDWDTAQYQWVYQHQTLFLGSKKVLIDTFVSRFDSVQLDYKTLRKQIIHNDCNDNNIIVSLDNKNPEIVGIIDFGDAIKSQLINEVANCIAYAAMEQPNPIEAACDVVKGFHVVLPLQDEELQHLHTLVGMRLVISVTKSALNAMENPANDYLQISSKNAWELLAKWNEIHPDLAYYSFRNACGFSALPKETQVLDYLKSNTFSANDLFKNNENASFEPIDLSIGSHFLGNYAEFTNDTIFNKKIQILFDEKPNTIFVGGYKEPRGVYTTDAFKYPTNTRISYRTLHLGVDFWTQANDAIFCPLDGEVVVSHYNNYNKDYGPTLILKHQIDEKTHFYTLYGHLTASSLDLKVGSKVKRGDLLARIGFENENGNWPPHLHFQIILDLLGHTENFNGVAAPEQWPVYGSICPNPNLLFDCEALTTKPNDLEAYENFRKKHLGKSLSLSYEKPLTILRGNGVVLYDQFAQPYLDTVNNVAHVGHENWNVVQAGQQQMAVLNTNTRYLHPQINTFAKELLATFPPELSVVHFVNSGSEANELALRMAKVITHQKDVIALEMGYHGNTQGCIDISSYKFDRKGGQGKPEHTHIVPLPDAFRGKHTGNDAGSAYAQYVLESIEEIQAKNRNVAAFIAESIVSCGGQIELPQNYLKLAYEHVRKAGGLCIADEVQVGFGRVGAHFWGFELHDVVPDIVVLGKPIGNGHPLGAVVCTEAVAQKFANGMEYFNTFGGNPVSCAIGTAVLNEIKTNDLQKNALEIGNYLISKCKKMQKTYPILADVRGKGLFLGLEFLEANKKPATEKVSYLTERMKARGILMSIDGPDNNVLKIKPPITFSKHNADFLLENLEFVLKEDFMRL